MANIPYKLPSTLSLIPISLATVAQPLEKLNRLVTFLASLIVRQADRVNNYMSIICFLSLNMACLSNSLVTVSPNVVALPESTEALDLNRHRLLLSFPNPFQSIVRALILFCFLTQIDKCCSPLFVRSNCPQSTKASVRCWTAPRRSFPISDVFCS